MKLRILKNYKEFEILPASWQVSLPWFHGRWQKTWNSWVRAKDFLTQGRQHELHICYAFFRTMPHGSEAREAAHQDAPRAVGSCPTKEPDYAKAFHCVDHNKLWKILKEMGIPDHLICLLRNLYAGQETAAKTVYETTN